jgi:hypothetical protein
MERKLYGTGSTHQKEGLKAMNRRDMLKTAIATVGSLSTANLLALQTKFPFHFKCGDNELIFRNESPFSVDDLGKDYSLLRKHSMYFYEEKRGFRFMASREYAEKAKVFLDKNFFSEKLHLPYNGTFRRIRPKCGPIIFNDKEYEIKSCLFSYSQSEEKMVIRAWFNSFGHT